MFILPDITPLSMAILVCVGAMAGYVRGYSGFGAGLLFMPTASAILGPQMAVAVFFVMDMSISLTLIPNAVRQAQWRTVTPLILCAFIGIPLGVYGLLHMDTVPLRWATSILIFAMLALLMSGWRYQKTPALPVTAGVGVLAGFLGGIIQVSGPPVVTFWMGGPLKPQIIRANLITFFAISSLGTAIAYAANGLFTIHLIGTILLVTPLFALSMWLGARRFVGTSDKTFRRIVYVLIAISALTSMPVLDSLLRA